MQHPTRQNFLCLSSIAAALGFAFKAVPAHAAEAAASSTLMSALTAIQTRRSVRLYTEQPISDKSINTLLAAGMAAPSAGNEQLWEFVVIRNPETLAQVGRINKYAAFAKKSPSSRSYLRKFRAREVSRQRHCEAGERMQRPSTSSVRPILGCCIRSNKKAERFRDALTRDYIRKLATSASPIKELCKNNLQYSVT
jgi:nitroreductase